MPLPKTKSVGKLMSFLKKENETRPKDKKWPYKQRVAIALTQAQKSGADIAKNEELEMKNKKEMRDFIRENINISPYLPELKKELRQVVIEMTTSSDLAIGGMNPTPAGPGDQAQVEPPEDINIIDIENPDEDEDEDDELEKLEIDNNIQESDYNDEGVNEDDVSDDELIQTLSDMDEEEFDELVSNMSEEEKDHLTMLIAQTQNNEQNEAVNPDEIVADTPEGIGAEDEEDGMIQVGDSLEDNPSKQRTVNQIEIDPEEESDADNVSPNAPSIADNGERISSY